MLCLTYSSPKITENKHRGKPSFDVNRKIVHAFGKGQAAIEHFSLGMNMNTLCSYYNHLSVISREAEAFQENVCNRAREKVKRAHCKENPEIVGKEIIDTGITFDGS